MAAIFKRETKSYYTGTVGYVTAAVSLFFLGLYFTNRNLMYASSDFASVLYTTTLIMLFLLPAISMRSFAEERRNKTDQLLLTSPVSIPGIVLGKFLAEVVVFALPLTVAVIMPLILTAFGTVGDEQRAKGGQVGNDLVFGQRRDPGPHGQAGRAQQQIRKQCAERRHQRHRAERR